VQPDILPTALKFLDSWLDYRLRQLDIPGLSVAILYDSDVVFKRAYGLANLARRIPLTPKHLFGMASQSKIFTATAALQLAEADRLRLDKPICDYLPWLAVHRDKRVQEITTEQLLSHRSGLIRDGQHTDFWQLASPFPSAEVLKATVLAADVVLEPNTQLKYSNLGLALAGQVIEATSGQSYTDYLHKYIIKPLRLKNTFADYTPAIADRLATAYSLAYEHVRQPLMPRLPTHAFAPSVGIHATPPDMCRFATAHFVGNETILSDTAKKQMRRLHTAGQDYDAGWEFGLGLERQNVGERQVFGHGGHSAGYQTATFFDPQARLAVSVAANAKDADIIKIARGIFGTLDWFTGHPGKPTAKLARLNVRLFSPTATIEVVATPGGIALIDPDDWEPFAFAESCELVDAHTLHITTPGSAFNQGESIRYEFAQNGHLTSVDYTGQRLLPETVWRKRAGP
jgi:D-alanyl-D-alanine carboxypeptidase